MSHYFLLILLSTWSQSETIAASKCFKYIEIEEKKRKFNPRKYGFHIMNHRIARVMDLSTGLHVTSKSGGGGGGSKKTLFQL